MVVVGLNSGEHGDAAPKARSFRDQHHLTYPIVLDAGDKARGALGILGFPTNIVIDREGKVRYVEPGFNQGAIDRTLRELMAP